MTDTTQHPLVIAEQRRRAFVGGVWALSAVVVAAFVFHTCDVEAASRENVQPAPAAETVCRAFMDEWTSGVRVVPGVPVEARVRTCRRLARLAAATDHAPPHLVIAIAYEEKHYGEDDAGSVRGPCQVARIHCPGRTFRGCDLARACVATVDRLMREEDGDAVVVMRRWLAGMRRGRVGPLDERRERWIGAVLRRSDVARLLLEAVR